MNLVLKTESNYNTDTDWGSDYTFDPDSELLGYQKKWLSLVLDIDKKVVVCEKARRTGITYTSALAMVLWCLKTNTDAFICSYNNEASKLAIRDCKLWLDFIEQKTGHTLIDEKTGYKSIINLVNGCRIQALPCADYSFRGKQGLFVLDEFAFYGNPEFFKSVMSTQIWGGKVAVISTHNGEHNFFVQVLKNYSDNVLRVTFREALRYGLYKKICQKAHREWSKHDEDKWADDIYKEYWIGADEELNCIPRKNVEISYENLKTNNFQIFMGVKQANRCNADYFFSVASCLHDRHVGIINVGIDIGYKNHPTAIVASTAKGEILFGIYLWDLTPRELQDIVTDFANDYRVRVYIDAQGVGYSTSELSRYHTNVTCVSSNSAKWKNSLDATIWQVLSGVAVYFSHPVAIEELKYISVGANGKITFKEYKSDISGMRHHCDLMVAYALSCYALFAETRKTVPKVTNW